MNQVIQVSNEGVPIVLLADALTKLEATYYCNLCAQTFSEYESLEKHSNMHHPNMQPTFLLQQQQQQQQTQPQQILVLQQPQPDQEQQQLQQQLQQQQQQQELEIQLQQQKQEEEQLQLQLQQKQQLLDEVQQQQQQLQLRHQQEQLLQQQQQVLLTTVLQQSQGLTASESPASVVMIKEETEITDNNSGKFTCDVCGKDFPQKFLLKEHEIIHTGVYPYRCNICGHTFSRNSNLSRHMKIHNTLTTSQPDDNPLTVPLTEGLNSGCSDVNTNQWISAYELNGSNPFDCKDCWKAFTQHKDVSVHERIHKALKPFDCKACGKSFSQRSHLKMHNQRMHSSAKQSTDNVSLSNMFDYKETISQNGKLKNEENPLGCDVCWKAFSQRSHSNLHKHIHNAVLPFVCSMCSKAFSTNSKLKRHKQTHLSEKLFQCDLCQKSFSQRSHLKVHSKIHSGERPYKCERCGYAFARNDHLERHKKANKGERKLSCVPMKQQQTENIFEEHPELQAKKDADSTAQPQLLENAASLPTINIVKAEDLQLFNIQAGQQQVQPHPQTVTIATGVPLTQSAPAQPQQINLSLDTQTTLPSQAQIAQHMTLPDSDLYTMAAQIFPSTQVFPTIQMYPSNAQVIPTLQMHPSAAAQIFTTSTPIITTNSGQDL